jgi:hypothetical protein
MDTITIRSALPWRRLWPRSAKRLKTSRTFKSKTASWWRNPNPHPRSPSFAHHIGGNVLKVKAGSRLIDGFINVSYREYEWEMAKGGNKYVEVHTKDGVVSFRYKYLREVKEL